MLKKCLPLLVMLFLFGCGGANPKAAAPAGSVVQAPPASSGTAAPGTTASAASSPGTDSQSRDASNMDSGTAPLYSNLDSEAAREETASRLAAAGIPSETVNRVFSWVADYNDCMRDCESFTLAADFTPMEGSAVDYGDYPPMSRHWYKDNHRAYHDLLCRIVAFELLKGQIAAANLLPQSEWACESSETDWLYSDWSILRGRAETADEKAYSPNPLPQWDNAALARYFTLYAPVAVPEGCTLEEQTQAVREAWTRRGVSFTPGKASLVTLWLSSGGSGNQIAVGHAAVLVEDDSGLLLFEKTNPESPYSAAKFQTTQQVKAYLLEMLRLDDARCGITRGELLLLRNRELFV